VSAQQPVRYRAKPGASVIISGGRAITGWQPDAQRPGVWKARAGNPTAPAGDAWRFNQLWINGRRGIRARTPNYWDFRVLKGVTEEPLASGNEVKHVFSIDPALEASLQGLDKTALQDVQIMVLHKWDTTREGLIAVSTKDTNITTHG